MNKIILQKRWTLRAPKCYKRPFSNKGGFIAGFEVELCKASEYVYNIEVLQLLSILIYARSYYYCINYLIRPTMSFKVSAWNLNKCDTVYLEAASRAKIIQVDTVHCPLWATLNTLTMINIKIISKVKAPMFATDLIDSRDLSSILSQWYYILIQSHMSYSYLWCKKLLRGIMMLLCRMRASLHASHFYKNDRENDYVWNLTSKYLSGSDKRSL